MTSSIVKNISSFYKLFFSKKKKLFPTACANKMLEFRIYIAENAVGIFDDDYKIT